MTKIVINKRYGGFGLSEEAVQAYAKRKGLTLHVQEINSLVRHYTLVPWDEFEAMPNSDESRNLYFSERHIERDDPDLIAVIEELGSDICSDKYAQLEIIEIPDGVDWTIEEYDGNEWIAEKHRTWN